MSHALADIEKILGYHFVNPALLTLALTHSSAAKENNERLEFLGDALVNLIIAEYLFQKFHQAQEGQLSRMRAVLVKGEALANLAQSLQLSIAIIVGPGEVLMAGKHRDSILAGVMEALIGAVYLDSDFNACSKCVIRWYGDVLKNITLEQQHVDAKTQLQELLQARRLDLPVYSVLDQKGQVHKQIFIVECRVAPFDAVTQAQGQNRKQAEQIAAQLMLEKIKHV